MRRLDEMNGGAFIFKLALLGLIPFVFLYADDGKSAAEGSDSVEGVVDLNGTVASVDGNGTVASVDGNGTVASVDGNGTVAANVPMEKEIPATLGPFSVIPRKDPFRLIKPEPPPSPKPEIVIPPSTKGVPTLVGISTLGGVNRALLRVSPTRGAAVHEFFEEGVGSQAYGWIKVVKIDLEKGQAVVETDDGTYDLELDKDSSVTSGGDSNATSTLRPTGKYYTFLQQPEKEPSKRYQIRKSPVRGATGDGRTAWIRQVQEALNDQLKSERKLQVDGDLGSNTTNALKKFQQLKKLPVTGKPDEATLKALGVSNYKGSPASGRGLKPAPKRNYLEFLKPFGANMYEEPAFDLRMQQFITDPAQLSIQREIIRGQYSHEVPTDLPAEER
ncbi:MAG: peptidoglycan-binding domain-containing protein [Verrucomicrobiota bacterium]|nr:peptidoglycan-binding domain-containing protein [Verrucomicrobiota bacterium]